MSRSYSFPWWSYHFATMARSPQSTVYTNRITVFLKSQIEKKIPFTAESLGPMVSFISCALDMPKLDTWLLVCSIEIVNDRTLYKLRSLPTVHDQQHKSISFTHFGTISLKLYPAQFECLWMCLIQHSWLCDRSSFFSYERLECINHHLEVSVIITMGGNIINVIRKYKVTLFHSNHSWRAGWIVRD